MNLQVLVLLLMITQLLTCQRTKRLSLCPLLGLSPRHRLRRSVVNLLGTFLLCRRHQQYAASRENRNQQSGCRHRRIKTHLRRKVKQGQGSGKPKGKRRMPKKKQKTITVRAKRFRSDLSSDEDEEWHCLICGEPFSNSRSREVWVQYVHTHRVY